MYEVPCLGNKKKEVEKKKDGTLITPDIKW